MPLTYQQHFTVNIFECDPWDRLSPGAALRRIQRIATAQCESLDINEAYYQRTHSVFLLSRMSFVISRMPVLYQAVTIETRAYGVRKAVYHRVTSLHAESGEKLCEADARWVLVDTESRRILRRAPPEFEALFNEAPGEEHDVRLPKMGEAATTVELAAALSLCDRNGHLNNTRYADLMCDLLPLEKMRQDPPQRMLFNYHSEIPLGAPFTLTCAPPREAAASGEEGYCFLAGSPESKNFEGYVALK